MRVIWLLIALLLLPCFAPEQSSAALDHKVVVVVINGLSHRAMIGDELPNLAQMRAIGAVGVMNHNTLGAKSEANSYLTIGAGAKASAPLARVLAYGADEQVREEMPPVTGHELYVRHLGRTPESEVVVPQLPLIKSAMAEAKYRVLPGLLGSAVHDLGGRTALLGNADFGSQIDRPAALIAMDERGTVDSGSLQVPPLVDRTRPFGVRSDLDGLYQKFLQLKDSSDLIVLETGDMGRLQQVKDMLTDAQVERIYQQTIAEADRLVGKLLPHVGANLTLLVISPDVSPLPETSQLTPVFLAGGDVAPGSLLTSSTTKRAGLIANYDLAPTVVRALGGDPARYPFLGQPASTTTSPDEMRSAVGGSMTEKMLLQGGARSLLVKPWLNVWIGVAALLLIGTVFRQAWLFWLAPLAEFLLLFPLIWLCVPLFEPLTKQQVVLDSLLLALVGWGALQFLRDRVVRLGVIAGLFVVMILGDMLLGAPLMKRSLFSYDPVVGARYYGIGNEYMGILLGAALLLQSVLFKLRPAKEKLITTLLFLTIVYLFAAPAFGTNAGGAIAAAVGAAYVLLARSKVKLTARHWLWLGAAGLGGAVLLFLLNLGGEQTHIGRAASLLLTGDYGELSQIALRKVELNLHLLRVSAWGKLLLLIMITLLVWRMRGMQTPFLLHNAKVQLVTASAAFLVNDSGVVAAVIILLFAVVPLLSIREQKLDILPSEQAPQEWTTR